MDNQDMRPWYKKKRYIIPIILIGLYSFNSSDTQSTQPVNVVATPANTVNTVVEPVKTQNTVSNTKVLDTASVKKAETASVINKNTLAKPINTYVPAKQINNNSLSNDNSYVNTAGNTVHSPAYSEDNSVPSGASALCRDGTYSFSQSRRGTCSHHGGVSRWL